MVAYAESRNTATSVSTLAGPPEGRAATSPILQGELIPEKLVKVLGLWSIVANRPEIKIQPGWKNIL